MGIVITLDELNLLPLEPSISPRPLHVSRVLCDRYMLHASSALCSFHPLQTVCLDAEANCVFNLSIKANTHKAFLGFL